VSPLVVHTMRPWIAGATGLLFACMWSARTWSMMFCVVARGCEDRVAVAAGGDKSISAIF